MGVDVHHKITGQGWLPGVTTDYKARAVRFTVPHAKITDVVR
jgi:hypothetical protein